MKKKFVLYLLSDIQIVYGLIILGSFYFECKLGACLRVIVYKIFFVMRIISFYTFDIEVLNKPRDVAVGILFS